MSSQSVSGSKSPSSPAGALADGDGLVLDELDTEADGEPAVFPLCDAETEPEGLEDVDEEAPALDPSEGEAEVVLLSDEDTLGDGELSSATAVGADSRASGAMAAVAAMVTMARRSFMKTSC
ncbi:hypothetical protein [Streptomyces sp. NPDC101166]|uniref:hypothetical protein n=1 Tax=Streptomyces sp. NPDC101166 TaxID=3366120 RepID=UPI003808700F